MRKIIFTAMAISIMVAAQAQAPQLGKASVDEVIKAMTLEEKVDLLVGAERRGGDFANPVIGETMSLVPGAAGTTFPIPRLGIPAVVMADGPAGLRIAPKREGIAETFYCTAFPVATLLAASWNPILVENVGNAIGNEVLEYGVDILLAPALNIHRNPLCGRNFEYYSEDPLLAGKTAAAFVRGVQSKGVGTSLKHFAANNQETNRGGNDVRITQRALREIYLKGFEIAIREAKPWTIMTSYNKINGAYASENRELLTTILRDEWGFEGTVMTDWNGGIDAPAQIYAGNDLLMPGILTQKDNILQAVKTGKLSEKDVDTDVRRILNLILKSPRFKGYKFSNKPDLKAHADLTRASATEGMVLLKNKLNTLPLKEKNIAVFGITSYEFIAGGTGSGDVNEAYTISLGEGLKNGGFTNNKLVQEIYDKHIAAEDEKNKPDPNNPWAMYMPRIRPAEFVPLGASLNQIAAESSAALLTLGRNSGEFSDRKLPDDFNLSTVEQELITNVCKAFHAAGKKVVVILNIGGVIETASWKEQPDAILLAWQPGQEGGNSVVDILSGKVNPSGKLPMTFPVNYMDIASSANFPYDAPPPGLSSFMSAQPTEVEEKTPERNIDYTRYEEDVYVGYRYFDTFGKEVSYPFGYGLSYSAFDYSQAKVKQNGANYALSVVVKNTGKTAGKEVVQLYASTPIAQIAKELKGFAKTKVLQPGESEEIALSINVADLASLDAVTNAWIVAAGDYQFHFGSSSADIKSTLKIKVAQKLQTKVHDVLKLQDKIVVLKK
ncbi:MAG: glycoside hydrolase family 3 C-terminal domain-containing protein [Dysgonamonadaceae bacterium]|jgi:beta-glucosidase|nr:glycoside hydrolase family 3 C-terminal domain-containing protein [Dysgonamonadaceae bacterium]